MLKKLISITMAIAIICTAMSGIVAYADEAVVQCTGVSVADGTSISYSLLYTTSGDAATITGFGTAPSVPIKCLEIPEKITADGVEYTVTAIGTLAFAGKNLFANVLFPDTIVTLGAKAFQNNNGTQSDTVQPLKFYGTDDGNSETTNDAENMILPSVLKTIGEGLFYNNISMDGMVTLPEGIETIGGCAFYNVSDSATTSLTIPSSVKSLDLSAFGRMRMLAEITFEGEIGEKFLTITHNEAINKWNSTRVNSDADGGNLGGGVKSSTGSGYTKFIFKDYDSLCNFAYVCCTSTLGFKDNAAKTYFIANNFEVKGATKDIGNYNCDVSGGGVTYNAEGSTPADMFIKKDISVTVNGFAEGKSSEVVDFTNGITDGGNTYKVTAIADAAFQGNATITEFVPGDDLVTIGKDAFKSSTALQRVFVPAKVTFGQNAFSGASNIRKIVFEDGITSIPNIFWNCGGVENIVIPSSIKSIVSSGSFKNLKNIVFEGETILKFTDLNNTPNIYVKSQNAKTNAENVGYTNVTVMGDEALVKLTYKSVARTEAFVYNNKSKAIDAMFVCAQYGKVSNVNTLEKVWNNSILKLEENGGFEIISMDDLNKWGLEVSTFLIDINDNTPYSNKGEFTLVN